MARLAAARLAFITVLASALAAAADDWSYDGRLLRECDTAWFAKVLTSAQFETYLKGEIQPGHLSSTDHAKLALAEAFLLDGELTRVLDVVLLESNPYVAAALYACLEGYMGDPMQSHYRFKQFSKRFEAGDAPDLDAAFFAHIRDEISFVDSLTFEVALIPMRYPREMNMYAAFANHMHERSQPYMHREWLRLSLFENNPEARAAAEQALLPRVEEREAKDFSLLVSDIRELYRIAATKRVHIFHRSSEQLPPPFEHLRAKLGRTNPPFVPIRIITEGGEVIAEREALHEGEAIPLPPAEGRDYVLYFARLGNLPYYSDSCIFMVVPSQVWHWKERADKLSKKTTPRRPDPKLIDPTYLVQITGTYGSFGGLRLKVRLKGDKLVVREGFFVQFDLVPFDNMTFSLGGTSAGTMEFRKNKDGTTTALLELRHGKITLKRVRGGR